MAARRSPIQIKESHEGEFTAWAKANGFSNVQAAARHVLAHRERYSTKRVRQANFARNAATKFKKR